MKQAKPVSAATRAMLDAMEEDAKAGPAPDKLDTIRKKVGELRDEQLSKQRIEEQLSECNKRILSITQKELPDIMDEAMVPSITLEADGNKPRIEVRVEDYYHANIFSGEKAEEAYDYLRKVKAEDLIKTQYVISFGLGEAKAAERFERSLTKAGVGFDRKQGVPWNTLTAWFREEYKRKPLPVRAMEVLGATVGRVAKVVKQKKEK